MSDKQPDWLDETKIGLTLDATPIINSGGSPMNEILKEAGSLKPEEIFEIKTPFVPAPIIDMLKKKGFRVFCVETGESVTTYICR
jgi:hypothetical protein